MTPWEASRIRSSAAKNPRSASAAKGFAPRGSVGRRAGKGASGSAASGGRVGGIGQRGESAACAWVEEADAGATRSLERGLPRAPTAAVLAAVWASREAHKNPTSPGSRAVYHEKPTDKTGLRGTRRHGCYHGHVSLLTSMYAGELGWDDGYGIMVPGVKEPLKSGRSAVRPRP